MLIDPKVLDILEFGKVLDQAAAFAATAWGRELVLELRPVAEQALVERRLGRTHEAAGLIERGLEPPFGGIRDLRPALARAKRGGVLEPADLLQVADTADGAARLREFWHTREEDAPVLAGEARLLGDHRTIATRVQQAITTEGEVADKASAELSRLRRALRLTEQRIRAKLEQLVRSAETQRHLQDAIVTIRDGRFVLPVRAESRHAVPGVVHDVSGSGQTVFVEPLAVVELNNELRKIAAEERAEVERILRELSRLVAEQADDLQRTCEVAAALDLAVALGRWAVQHRAVRPELAAAARLDLKQARHPLLGEAAVPLDIRLGDDFDVLVLTGPNTGGKTVTLKTTGLFVLLAQSGFMLPAAPGTVVGRFEAVFADIGDEQSIEQSLSTFSGHMRNIVRILAAAGRGSLVLLDELGAGTDPAEGAALAMALIQQFQAQGVRLVTTTHYSELKTFAYTQPRVQNAAVEFDVESLRPTYRLHIGLPGSSNAFAIASRLGLPASVVARAEAHLEQEQRDVAALLREAEAERLALAAERERLAAELAEAERQRELAVRRANDAAAKADELVSRARAEAESLVTSTRRETERLIKELRKARTEREQEEAIQAARESLQAAQERLGPAAAPAGEPPTDLRVGETVHIVTLGTTGTVLSEPEGGQVLVQAGIIRAQVALTDLRRSDGEAGAAAGAAAGAGAGTASRRRTRSARAGDRTGTVGGAFGGDALGVERRAAATVECDLRGLTVDEAIERADKFLDEALLGGLDQVRLIHGKGTGALRQAIGRWLKSHPNIRGHRLGDPGEGGDGVTVAQLR